MNFEVGLIVSKVTSAPDVKSKDDFHLQELHFEGGVKYQSTYSTSIAAWWC